MPDRSLKGEHYHRAELRIALDPSDPEHLQPPPLPRSHKVLDIGCGAGQTLIAAYPDRISFGLDIDLNALKLGRSLTDHVCFVCGKAESLPLPNGQFDMVIARGSLSSADISASLKEIHRVLRRDGELWMALEPFTERWSQAMTYKYKGLILFAIVVLNSVFFHLTQKSFPFLRRYGSFQTERGISRALIKNGFEGISITRAEGFFQVTARSR